MTNKQKGFTLIELVIVLAIFMIVMEVSVTMFIAIVKHQKQILAEQELLSQVSYLQEHLSYGLRSAKKDVAGNCLASGSLRYLGNNYLLTRYNAGTGFYQGVKFMLADNSCHEIFLDSDGILKEIKNGTLAQNVLSDIFIVGHAKFVINGDRVLYFAADGARITVSLSIKTDALRPGAEKNIQTTISLRK